MTGPGGADAAMRRVRRRRELATEARAFYRRVSKYFSYRRLVSIERLRRYRNAYRGGRCFVLGSGPSLNHTDLSLLRNEITFGTNRQYLLFDTLGFATTFFLAVDPLVVQRYHRDIDRLDTVKFLPARHRRLFAFDRRTVFFEEARRLTFSLTPARGYWDGGSVTYIALQLAFHMGFETVYLVGVDHSYSVTKTHREDGISLVETSDGNDHDHFSPDYFEPGASWFVPNLELKELGYRMAKYAFERRGRRILDATVGGKLEVFPKIDYATLF